ncbi:MAG: GNAT family N-acetyltransferase [Candidatus Latescibacterota bacterium]|nr:GNAT family N-acetyltransferase [Candidatus Latescibacterota bacterium]
MIRPYTPADLDRLKEITEICFDGASIDRNIETLTGSIGGHDWVWRKLRHIDDDVSGSHATGVFVWDGNNKIEGYVTTRIDDQSKIGGIPNIAVDPQNQGCGIGRALLEHALEYMSQIGMEYAKIETLAQNEVGKYLYPDLGFVEIAQQIHYIKRL